MESVKGWKPTNFFLLKCRGEIFVTPFYKWVDFANKGWIFFEQWILWSGKKYWGSKRGSKLNIEIYIMENVKRTKKLQFVKLLNKHPKIE